MISTEELIFHLADAEEHEECVDDSDLDVLEQIETGVLNETRKRHDFRKVFCEDIFKKEVKANEDLYDVEEFDEATVEMIFHEVDDDSSGLLDFEEFRAALPLLKIHMNEAKCKRYFLASDTDKSGLIDITEFKAAVFGHKQNPSKMAYIKSSTKDLVTAHPTLLSPQDAFNYFDEDSSGFVDELEFGNLVEYLEVKLTDAKLEKLFRKHSNQDNVITLDAFVKVFVLLSDPLSELTKRGIKPKKGLPKIKLREMLEVQLEKEEAIGLSELQLVTSYRIFESKRNDLLLELDNLIKFSEHELAVAMDYGGQTYIFDGRLSENTSPCSTTSWHADKVSDVWQRLRDPASVESHKFWGLEIEKAALGVESLFLMTKRQHLWDESKIGKPSDKLVYSSAQVTYIMTSVYEFVAHCLVLFDKRYASLFVSARQRKLYNSSLWINGESCLNLLIKYLRVDRPSDCSFDKQGNIIQFPDWLFFLINQSLEFRAMNLGLVKKEIKPSVLCFLIMLEQKGFDIQLYEKWKRMTDVYLKENNKKEQIKLKFKFWREYYPMHDYLAHTSKEKVLNIFLSKEVVQFIAFWDSKFKLSLEDIKFKAYESWKEENSSDYSVLSYVSAHPEHIDHVKPSKHVDWKHIASGGHNFVASNKNNEILFFGSNNFNKRTQEMSQMFNYGKNIHKSRSSIILSSGFDHTSFVDDAEPEVLCSFGKNNVGQLGCASSEEPHPYFYIRRIQFNAMIKVISCGNSHSAAIDCRGALYVWGSNDAGKLGFRDFLSASNEVWKPSRHPHFENMELSSVSCGCSHTLLLSRDGYVFAAGGASALGRFTERFVLLDSLPVIDKISCGYDVSLCLSSEGEVFGFGRNVRGSLGLPESKSFFSITEITKLATYTKPSNLALNKPSIQSSIYASLGPSYGNNGILLAQSLAEQKYVHTQLEKNPFWQVDLGSPCIIHSVKIYNRYQTPFDRRLTSTYYCERLFPLIISIHDLDAVDINPEDCVCVEMVSKPERPEEMEIVEFFPSRRVVGSKVRIHIDNSETYLHFIELQVFGWVVNDACYSNSTPITDIACGNEVTVLIAREKKKYPALKGELESAFLRATQADRQNAFILAQVPIYSKFFKKHYPFKSELFDLRNCILCTKQKTCPRCVFFDKLSHFEPRRLSKQNLIHHDLQTLRRMLDLLEFDKDTLEKVADALSKKLSKPSSTFQASTKKLSSFFKILKNKLPRRKG